MPEKKIARVILWSNGMVIVFDSKGEQLSDYQGRFHDVIDRIAHDAPRTASFSIGVYGVGSLPTSIESLLSDGWRYDGSGD